MNTISRISSSLGAYVAATLQNALITTLLFVVGFALAGMPWWFVVGLICGILNLVPYLGPILSLGVAILAGYLSTDDYARIAVLGGVWLAVQILDGFVLSPRAAGKAGVHPI
ncbi:MAG: AI-2E family transporter, partial [Bryobacteraceae bacterium]|nr:AI-2E family transporter [Bryobacteraceae bacterium]